jgi:hypothetical protein
MHGSVKIFCVPFDLHDHSLHMSVVGGGGRGWSSMMRRDEEVVCSISIAERFLPAKSTGGFLLPISSFFFLPAESTPSANQSSPSIIYRP